MRGLWARLRAIRRQRESAVELDEELRFHRDHLTAGYQAQGIPHAEAMRRAQLELGGTAQILEQCRDQRGVNWLEDALRDTALALRNLGKSPGFTAAAIFTLALGIGLNTALFTLLYSVAFRQLPVSDPGALRNVYVQLSGDGNRSGYGSNSFQSFPEFQYMQGQAKTAELAAVAEAEMSPRGLGIKTLRAQLVSSNLLAVMGARPSQGRFFLPEETARPGGKAVAVLSYGLWRGQFAGAADVVGRTVTLNRTVFTIVGVAGQGFSGPLINVPDLWIPITMQAITRPGESLVDDADAGFIQTFARLRPGTTDKAVLAEMTVLAPSAVAAHGSAMKARALVVPAAFMNYPDVVGAAVPVLGIISLAGMLVLLVACANVANLLLARGLSRRREIAIRLAIGAGRGRVLRQLLTESLLLGLLGGSAGIVLAWQAGSIGLKFVPAEAGILQVNLTPDPRVLLFAVLVSLAAALGSGLLPAFHVLRLDLTPSLKTEGLLDTRKRRLWLQNILVGVQIAVSVVLLVNAGLMIRGFRHAAEIGTGRQMKGLLIASFNLRQQQFTPETAQRFHERVAEKLRTSPEIAAVSVSLLEPELGSNTNRANPVGADGTRGSDMRVHFDEVGPEYFRAAGLHLLAGRSFTAEEVRSGAQVVLIDDQFAQTAYHGQAIGRRLSIGSGEKYTYQIIGVVANTRSLSALRDNRPWYYIPMQGLRFMEGRLWIRYRGTAAAERVLRAAVQQEDPEVTATARTTEEDVALAMMPVRVASWAASALGMLALVVAAIGLYGVVAFAVSRRLREMGVRMALGASASDLLRLVFGQLPGPVGVGSVIGMAAAIAFAHLIRAFLYGISPFDPVALVSVVLILALVAMAASWAPARRAARVDPASVLRND